jgi:hypothetical protein
MSRYRRARKPLKAPSHSSHIRICLENYVPRTKNYRIRDGALASDDTYGNNGAFSILFESFTLNVIASDGEGWEHVSVSMNRRTPNWREMCFIKDLFWDPEDVVIQYHPAKSEYVNNHNYCLHLWRPIGVEIPTPPKILVGY